MILVRSSPFVWSWQNQNFLWIKSKMKLKLCDCINDNSKRQEHLKHPRRWLMDISYPQRFDQIKILKTFQIKDWIMWIISSGMHSAFVRHNAASSRCNWLAINKLKSGNVQINCSSVNANWLNEKTETSKLFSSFITLMPPGVNPFRQLQTSDEQIKWDSVGNRPI